MAAINETWEYDGGKYVSCIRNESHEYEYPLVRLETNSGDCISDEHSYLKLAACAPEALRMLLDLEWSGCPEGSCPSCGQDERGRLTGQAGHVQDCALAALLVKAGLR